MRAFIKLIVIGLVAEMLFLGQLNAQTQTAPSGTGTELDPYLIESLENLYWVQQNSTSWDKHFLQTANIDAIFTLYWDDDDTDDTGVGGNNEGFYPIGNGAEHFTGTYDGGGYTINSLVVNRPLLQNVGLFGYVSAEGVVKNVQLVSVAIEGQTKVGAVVGFNYGSLVNCNVTGTLTGISYIGGLVGYNCGSIQHSSATSLVVGTASYIGGLVGYNYQATIMNSFAKGNVEGEDKVGGLVGMCDEDAVDFCYSVSEVSANYNVGGLVGVSNLSTVNACFWDVQTSGMSTSSGGTGLNTNEMKLASNYVSAGWDWVGEAENGTEDIWTIVYALNSGYPKFSEGITLVGSGSSDDPFQIANLDDLVTLSNFPEIWGEGIYFEQTADIDASQTQYFDDDHFDDESDAGNNEGFSPIGNSSTSQFNAHYDGQGHVITNLNINRDEDCQALFGYVGATGSVINLGLQNPSVVGDETCGSIAGVNNGSIEYCCSIDGSVHGNDAIGGFVGSNSGVGTIQNAYAKTGSYTTGYNVGGFVASNNGQLLNCYSTGEVEGFVLDYTGGFVGDNSGSVQACFWDEDNSGQSSSNGGVGLSYSEIQEMSFFIDAAWDFVFETENGSDNIWFMTNCFNDGTPALFWQTYTDAEIPEVICPSDLTINLESGEESFIADMELEPLMSSDNCSILLLENDMNFTESLNGAVINPGEYTINWTATDYLLNENTCSFDLVVNQYVGLDDVSQNISITPNPTTDFVNIVSHGNHQYGLYDLSGRCVLQGEFNHSTQISLRDMPSGLYVLSVDGQSNTQIIKQ